MKIRSCPSAPLRTGFDKALHERLSSLSPAPFRIKGFTLLEILIALAIFAILSMMAYAGLASILNARAATEPRSEQLAQLQTTLYLLNEDLSQASNRPIRDELGTAEPAFTGGRGSEILTLTRNVPLWSKDTAANSLQRISYRFENGALYRQVWAFTDRTPQSTFRRRKLINADHVTVRYFYETEQRWMSLNGSGSGVPNAVEVNFILSGLGSIQRLFLIHQ
ncbi:MAG: type II secretion system minor pseudopilin GspJ [Methylococcaceae bacterium]|nr:type II secretion system minor pseudopilin GspJ [Methylococcaceae bacterium]